MQPIDGLGFASPFQRSTLIRGDRGLSQQSTRAVLDLLFDRETGAGSSIVRIGIGSSTDDVHDHMKTIEPNDPGGPDATPQYVWDGDDTRVRQQTVYQTDETHSVARVADTRLPRAHTLQVQLPPRALTTLVLR